MGNEVSVPDRNQDPNHDTNVVDEKKKQIPVDTHSRTDDAADRNDSLVVGSICHKEDRHGTSNDYDYVDDEISDCNNNNKNDNNNNNNSADDHEKVAALFEVTDYDDDTDCGDWEVLEEGIGGLFSPMEIGEIKFDPQSSYSSNNNNNNNNNSLKSSDYDSTEGLGSPTKQQQQQPQLIGNNNNNNKTTILPKLCQASPPGTPPLSSPYVSQQDIMTIISLDEPTIQVIGWLSTMRRYATFATILFVLSQMVVFPTLKHFHIIEQEFVDSAVDRVIRIGPHLWSQYSADDEAASLSYLVTEETRPGYQLAQQGAKAKYPIVLVPGFVTSGLEVWGGKKCAKQYFRQRFWTALTSARTFLLDTACWNEHMMLDPYTGGDPENGEIRLRASEGFAGADYFLPFYWVWGKMIENLADVGYTPSTMTMEPYDWRLPFHMLEERDGYFTKLRYRIESMHKAGGKKVVLATHSMGALVLHHFLTWVSRSEYEGGGGMDTNWVDDHIHTYIAIAGCHLGVPKAATALLSGEIKDTVFMGAMGMMAEQFFGRRMRRELWSTFGSLWMMLPKGGEALWGPGSDMCMNSTENDPFCPVKKGERAPLIQMTDGAAANFTIGIPDALQSGTNLNVTLKKFVSKEKHSTTEVIQFLQTYGSGLGPKTLASKLSLYGRKRWSQFRHSVWNDPTRTPLPYAPHMKIFCLYGTGLPTERAFHYKVNWESDTSEVNGHARAISDPSVIFDDAIESKDNHVTHGIRYSDGDGSVPLISLGYICADAWKRDDSGLNPSGIPVYAREYKHEFKFTVDDPIRSGPSGSDHVDILGNVKMTEDFLRLVTDFGSDIVHSDHIVSDIKVISNDINKRGGIYKKWYFHRWQNLLIQLVLTDQQL